MLITLNGQKKQIEDNTSLKELITSICKNPKHIIAELNEQIIKSNFWDSTPLKNEDSIELVTFVGGG